MSETGKKLIFTAGVIFCLLPISGPPTGLLAGLIVALVVGNPYQKENRRWTKIILQSSVVGLGFGMNLFEALKASQEGFIFTIASIVVTLVAGFVLGKVFKIEKKIAYLISAGTAICGGSAIAAIAPIIDAKEEEISVSLGTVFVLNSVALVLFPIVGIALHLSQTQFGLWSAIAIHDTSSVVGAATKYGTEALKLATTIKLERALWIIPLSFVTALLFRNKESKIAFPWFILFFLGAMTLNTLVPQMESIAPTLFLFAKKGLTLSLFLIGAGLSRETLQKVGARPFFLGVLLWMLISIGSLMVILQQVL